MVVVGGIKQHCNLSVCLSVHLLGDWIDGVQLPLAARAYRFTTRYLVIVTLIKHIMYRM